MCVLCLNHRDELDRSTLNLDSGQIDVSVTETNSTAQYKSVRSTHTCTACINVCVLYIALASVIYTQDYISQKEHMKFDQPYLSENGYVCKLLYTLHSTRLSSLRKALDLL